MTKKPSLIEILGAIICGNSIFTLISFAVSIFSLGNIGKTLGGVKLTNSELWLNSISTGMSQITSWTALLGAILWLVWLFLCFGKYNQTELKKVNQIGTVLHYVLGSFFFGIPLLYLPFHHYKLLFGKINKTSKLPLIWQILNILTLLFTFPIMVLSFVTILIALFPLYFLSFINTLSNNDQFMNWFMGVIRSAYIGFSLFTTFTIFILLIYLVQTLLSCFLIWQISEKL